MVDFSISNATGVFYKSIAKEYKILASALAIILTYISQKCKGEYFEEDAAIFLLQNKRIYDCAKIWEDFLNTRHDFCFIIEIVNKNRRLCFYERTH